VAILSPDVIFRVPLMPRGIARNFRWTALSDCRVAKLSTEHFVKITLGIRPADYAKVANTDNARLGYMLGRYPSFLLFNSFLTFLPTNQHFVSRQPGQFFLSSIPMLLVFDRAWWIAKMRKTRIQ
jgi:hypothetical protein